MYINIGEFMNEIIGILPNEICAGIKSINNLEEITEIRLRVGKCIFVYLGLEEKRLEYVVKVEDLINILKNVSANSIYSVQQDINNGFLSIDGGHRIGVVGEGVLDNGVLKNIKHFSSMNIRVAKQHIGISDKIMPEIFDGQTIKNTLIISPPLCGKTTLLRDIIRNISNNGKNTLVIDERGELAAVKNGKYKLDLGERTDVISFVPKCVSVELGIRSMAPEVICMDEIANLKDLAAIEKISKSGVKFVATMHGETLKDLENSDLKELLTKRYIDLIVILSRKNGIGTIEKIIRYPE